MICEGAPAYQVLQSFEVEIASVVDEGAAVEDVEESVCRVLHGQVVLDVVLHLEEGPSVVGTHVSHGLDDALVVNHIRFPDAAQHVVFKFPEHLVHSFQISGWDSLSKDNWFFV